MGPTRTRKHYSDEEKALALALLDACSGDIAEASRRTGIPDSTLSQWRDGKGVHFSSELREDKRIELASKLDQIAMKAAGLAVEKIEEASVRDLMGAIKISTEMGQLLRNQPTSINENRNLTADERNDRIAEILEQAAYRRGVAAPDATGAGRTN